MATCQQVIDGALRKLGKLGAGRTARTVDAADALESLKGLYRSLINSGAFGRLCDVTPTTNYTARENERIFRYSESTLTVDLPALVDDISGSCLREYGSCWIPPGQSVNEQRPPRDCSVVVVSDAFTGTTEEYIYDAQERLWRSVGDISLSDEAPLSTRDRDGLSANLAMQIADEYGGDVSPFTIRLANLFRSNLVSRWSSPRKTLVGSYM